MFLLVRGFFARSLRQIALAVVLFAIWGGVLLGVLPGAPEVSWQGHLFGALAGLLCAALWPRPAAARRRGRASWSQAAVFAPRQPRLRVGRPVRPVRLAPPCRGRLDPDLRSAPVMA